MLTEEQLKDIYETALLDVLKVLEEKINQGGWDQPHALGAVYRIPLSLPKAEGLEDFGAVAFDAHPLPGINEAFAQYPPAEVLHSLADLMEESKLDMPVPPNLVSIYFASEVWALLEAKDAPETMKKEIEEIASRHEINAHPDRVEMRTITSLDRNNRMYIVSRRRDNDEVKAEMADFKHESGSIPEALYRILATVPERIIVDA